MTTLKEKASWKAKWQIKKWQDEAKWKGGESPYEVVDIDGNQLENCGINELFTIICDGPTAALWDNANAYLGVGASTDAFDATDTDLQEVAGGVWVGMDAGFPTYGTNQKATWQATFTGLVANQAWQEFAVCNHADGGDSGTILNRKVSDQGTKTAGQVWQLTLEITLS